MFCLSNPVNDIYLTVSAAILWQSEAGAEFETAGHQGGHLHLHQPAVPQQTSGGETSATRCLKLSLSLSWVNNSSRNHSAVDLPTVRTDEWHRGGLLTDQGCEATTTSPVVASI